MFQRAELGLSQKINKGHFSSMERKVICQLKIVQESNWLPHNERSPHSSAMCPGRLTSHLSASVIPSRNGFSYLEDLAGLPSCSFVMSCNNLLTQRFCGWHYGLCSSSVPLPYFASCRAALNLFVQHLLEPHCNISLEDYPLKCFEVVPAAAVVITVTSF